MSLFYHKKKTFKKYGIETFLLQYKRKLQTITLKYNKQQLSITNTTTHYTQTGREYNTKCTHTSRSKPSCKIYCDMKAKCQNSDARRYGHY
jgi:hypothetical protein